MPWLAERATTMDVRERLREVIDEQQGRLSTGVLPGREAALLSLVEAADRRSLAAGEEMALVTGGGEIGLGMPTALRLAFEHCSTEPVGGDHTGWADAFLAACCVLEAARLVERYAATGDIRLMADGPMRCEARFDRRMVPRLWLERADMALWERSSACGTPRDPGSGVSRMCSQMPYPVDSQLGGFAVRTWLDVVGTLSTMAPDGPGAILDETLVQRLSMATGVIPDEMAGMLLMLTLDAANAAWHAALPGGPRAPLVRLGPGRLAWSRSAAGSEPLLYVTRELRRRNPEQYRNAAHLREAAFRHDLYQRFAARRFMTSADRIVLRGENRRTHTDIDAAIFDRKTGTLALFELKAQDPLARSADEATRQVENLRRAGQQVAVVTSWINRFGADDVLNRMDRATAKRFRVQRVLLFVLGRYFGMGDPGRRGKVAWGSWGQVLGALDTCGGANPLASLHGRLLAEDRRDLLPAADTPPLEIALGDFRLVVRPAQRESQRK